MQLRHGVRVRFVSSAPTCGAGSDLQHLSSVWLWSAGPSPRSTSSVYLKFLAYNAAFVALPGAALLWAVRGPVRPVWSPLRAWLALGQALEILAFSAPPPWD